MVVLAVLAGAIIVGLASYGMFRSSEAGGVIAVICGLLGGVVGWIAGQSAALVLRAQAQLLLCLAEIESNSRRASLAAASAADGARRVAETSEATGSHGQGTVREIA